MQKSLKKKLTGSMMLTILASMAIVAVCLLLGMMRYSSARFSRDVSGVFTSDLINELNAAASGTPESAAIAVQQIVDVHAARLGIGTGREYSIWDVQTGSCVAGTQTDDASITNNIVTAMNGEVGDAMPLLKTSMDIAIPVTGDVELVVDIRDDGSFMRNLCWNVFALLLAALILSLAMCLVLSTIFANAFAQAAVQTAQELRKKGKISDDQLGKGWEVIGIYEPGTQPQVRHRFRQRRNTHTDALDTASKYISDGYVKFTPDGTILHINDFAAELLGISKNAENLTFGEVFTGVPIPTDKQRMVHGEFIQGEKQLDVVFIALESGSFAAIVRPVARE